MSFGFPSGAGLVQDAIRQLGIGKGPLVRLLASLGQDQARVSDFRSALIAARPMSLDAFVEHRSDFFDIGKAVIAACMIPYEASTTLLHPDQFWWYDYLAARLMDHGPDGFRANQLAVVTFNYDRSLELFLFTRLKNLWGLTDEGCRLLVRLIPLVHVYGQLGKLPEVNDGEGRAFGAGLDHEGVTMAMKEMQVIHEAQTNSAELQHARKLLHWADRILFLGFGFHPKNLERLGVREFGARAVGGTAFNLLEGERQPIRDTFEGGGITLGDPDEDVLLFLRRRPLLS
jgi:hypothetical protein